MKVLWFSNTSSLYDQGKHSYNGGGWIESLEELISERNDIDLAISFFHNLGFQKEKKGNTTYYPILKKARKKTPIRTIINGFQGKIESENKVIPSLLRVIEDFKPDIIQVFGTEGVFASIQKYTDIPVVIHLQGLIIPYLNAYFPPNQSYWNFILSKKFIFKNITGSGVYASYMRFKNQAIREKSHLENAKYLMGRTDWDCSISKIYSPDSQYFHIEEVLRPLFYNNFKKEYKLNSTIKIVSTLSETVYKGIDVILKCAKLLKEQTSIDFVWQVVGLDRKNSLLNHFIKENNVKPEEFNIEFVGKKNPKDLILILEKTDLFIHPSYIDNSPNSICEAQIVGIPVIACNVGGLSTLIENYKTGILVPSNGVFEIVSAIIDYNRNPEVYFNIGRNSKEIACKRHDKKNIVSSLISSYSQVIKICN
ncbi:glycosyltransferase [Flavobacterium sp. KACC 22761]|uniref:glycosyltransferase family 4 protein n=1 Tax=Flavobacterium sp. KACC 22761 TaxID=3092665 RepID=UPI002A74A41B|nr:glycosyltransferase [Flavobacterium sp. KACC 22761]WPO79093.1 glycosyltransferase [Flavobacterium sp. KACC 22761]